MWACDVMDNINGFGPFYGGSNPPEPMPIGHGPKRATFVTSR